MARQHTPEPATKQAGAPGAHSGPVAGLSGARRRRIWSETVPHARIIERPVREMLARFGLELLVAVRPWDGASVARVVAECGESGVPVALWPMLADEDGRWAHASNADAFRTFALRQLD